MNFGGIFIPYSLQKTSFIELFTNKFENEISENNKLWISKIEEMKTNVYQKGIDDGMKNIEVELDKLSLDELINIFKQQLKKQPTTKEVLLIKEINTTIDKIYMEGFSKGLEIKMIVDKI